MKKIILLFFALFSFLSMMPGFSQVDDGLPLPFLEQWNTGTFETNNWQTEGENWSINWQEGQPGPSAEFTWDPIQNNYQIALESYPLLADSLTEGAIYLDFDIKLDNYQPTGTEEMLVQVWNLDSLEWATVWYYSNEDGSFDWMSEHLNITDEAMGKVFKIRFLASGEYSLRLLGWFVDNIHVYRKCNPPANLEVDITQHGIVLDWDSPLGTYSQWIHWDDGANNGNAIGTGDEVEFDAAARWIPAQMEDYQGNKIITVSFYPGEVDAMYNIRIWTGANAANMVVDQPVTEPVIGQWNDITLDSPIAIDISQELWIGYHVVAQTGYPAGVDNGPAIDGFGNMMNFGGWQTLLEINSELDYNWNIKAYIQPSNLYDSAIAYAIYRADDDNSWFLRAYADQTYYLDDSICGWPPYLHEYQVKALYINGNDTCVSNFSNSGWESCGGMKDYDEDSLVIYPNPASNVLYIEALEEIESVTIFDSRGIALELWNSGTLERKGSGQVVRWYGGKVGGVEIPIDGLAPGLYFIRVETGSGVVARKVIVGR